MGVSAIYTDRRFLANAYEEARGALESPAPGWVIVYDAQAASAVPSRFHVPLVKQAELASRLAEGDWALVCATLDDIYAENEGLNRYFDGIFRECTRNIVGVQMRNCATVGGSIFARFGFSDILTCLLALDAYVELYHEGTIPLSEFAARPVRRDQKDILVRIIIKKDGRKAAYTSQRNSRTDFPVIACCVSNLGNKWFVSVGARPAKAKTVIITEDDFDTLKEMAKQAADAFTYGDNVRASGAYRKTLATVYIRRLMEQIKGRSVGRV